MAAGAFVGAATPGVVYGAEEEIEEVVVTGSRIPRANLTAPTAVTTIDAVDIEQSGLINVADVMRTLPSLGVSALSSGNSNFFTTSSGINTLQLRNLEEDRTLVLVNGRRYVSGLAGSSAVDFNTIPTALIERVEVITGGASAIYGSDALAGVINVILKDDFEGVEVSYQYGEADKGGDIQHEWTFTAGGNFADGRGNAVVSATYSDQKGLFARERSNTEIDDVALCAVADEFNPDDCDEEVEPFFSSFSEHGRFFVPSTGDSFTLSEGVGPTGTVVPWDGDAFGFNRQAFRRYVVPTERYMVSTLMDFDMTEGVTAFAEALFTQTRTESELEPFPHSNSDLNIGGISVDNPFVPDAIRDAVVAAGDDEIQYFRRTTEVGNRGASSTRDTYRFLVGFEGMIQDKWAWETFFSYGRMDDAQQGGGQINVLNMREALNAVVDPVSGEIVCANEAARLEGCEPINLFGLGSITPEAAQYVQAPTSRQQLTEQQNFGASLAGPLFEMPAGPVDFAVGFEWRDERAEDVPDVLTQAGTNAGNAEAPTFGGYDVWEAFLEVEVPLLSDMPGVYELSVGGAFRYSDYNTVGSTEAYTGRIFYSPIEQLRIRAQYARAVRAPNISELFAPGGENFATVQDPCNGVTATSAGNVDDNCRSIPAIAARIASEGVFDLTQTELQGTGGFTGQGNPDLDVETSDSYSVGFVYDADLGAVGTLTASVDYFDIEIEDLIDTIDRTQAVNFCFDTAPSQFPNEFCSNLTRDEDGPAFQLGELTEVNSGFINEGTLETTGIDFAMNLGWTWADWIGAIPGQSNLRFNYTYLLDFNEVKFGAEDDQVGETGFAEHEWQAGLGYTVGGWTASWDWVYIDDSVPDNASPFFSQYNVGDYNVHDLYVAYDFAYSGFLGDMFAEGTGLYVGVNNVFDEDAPVILTGVPSNVTGTDTDANVYNPIGRTYFAGVKVKF